MVFITSMTQINISDFACLKAPAELFGRFCTLSKASGWKILDVNSNSVGNYAFLFHKNGMNTPLLYLVSYSKKQDDKEEEKKRVWIMRHTQQEHSRLLPGRCNTKCIALMQTKAQSLVFSNKTLKQAVQSSAFPFQIPTLQFQIPHIKLLPFPWSHCRIPISQLPERI